MTTDHFKGKSARAHVAEAQAQGKISHCEIHGVETPGSKSAALDTARDLSVLSLLLYLISLPLQLGPTQQLYMLTLFLTGFWIWKVGRSTWLGWSRLERLHRVLEEERWEITHHRAQEREELGILYAAKGFEGRLLEEVLDVLMADGDRLLKVMVEEELGLSLEAYEHPLKQGLGAAIGGLIALLALIAGFMLWPPFGLCVASAILIGLTGYLAARMQGNQTIPAVIWHLGIAALAAGTTYFLIQLWIGQGWWR